MDETGNFPAVAFGQDVIRELKHTVGSTIYATFKFMLSLSTFINYNAFLFMH